MWFFLNYVVNSQLFDRFTIRDTPIRQDIPHYLLHCMDVFEWIGTVAGPLNGDRFVIGTVLFFHSQIKWVLAGLRPSPGRHCFHADFAQEHNTLIHVVVFLVSACLTVLWFFHASAHRNHGESWTRLVLGSCCCCIFSHRCFCENMCSSPALSLGRVDCRLDQLYCFISIIIIIIIIIIMTIFITIIFKAFKINRSFLYQ